MKKIINILLFLLPIYILIMECGCSIDFDEFNFEWTPPEPLAPCQIDEFAEEMTDARDGQVYEEFKKQGEGTYHCAGCGAELFSSKEKFDSHCGWPSFYDPSKVKNVKYNVDYVLGYPRTEVRCKVCDGHLGHVFDGEGFATPTDKRYCINGTVLKFVPRASGGESAESAKPKAGDAKESESAADPAKAEKKPG